MRGTHLITAPLPPIQLLNRWQHTKCGSTENAQAEYLLDSLRRGEYSQHVLYQRVLSVLAKRADRKPTRPFTITVSVHRSRHQGRKGRSWDGSPGDVLCTIYCRQAVVAVHDVIRMTDWSHQPRIHLCGCVNPICAGIAHHYADVRVERK